MFEEESVTLERNHGPELFTVSQVKQPSKRRRRNQSKKEAEQNSKKRKPKKTVLSTHLSKSRHENRHHLKLLGTTLNASLC